MKIPLSKSVIGMMGPIVKKTSNESDEKKTYPNRDGFVDRNCCKHTRDRDGTLTDIEIDIDRLIAFSCRIIEKDFGESSFSGISRSN